MSSIIYLITAIYFQQGVELQSRLVYITVYGCLISEDFCIIKNLP